MKIHQLFALTGLQIAGVMSVEWHFVSYYTASGQEFIGQTGTMVVPPLPEAQTNYVWPGLQPTDNSGVYQNVLDGKSGTWWIGSGWCCSNPSLPWGSGFNVVDGDTVAFNNTKTDSTTWTSTLVKNGGTDTVTDTFALGSKSFNDAPFAIELYGTWDFGPVTFKDIVLRATGSSTSFCTSSPSNYNSATSVTITDVAATVGDGYVDCSIGELTLNGAA